jgi:outer membrane receptor for ferrienterochelin and colicins
MHARSVAVGLGVLAWSLGAVPAMGGEADAALSEVETIVVTASGRRQDLSQAPASMSVVDRDDLQRIRVDSLPDALQGLPGVNVSPLDARDGKTGNQSISLRGLPREYTLVMIDGVRQNPMGNVTPNSFNDSQSVFMPPASAIERIEVVRGPMSTLYGSDALGGVINIITRRPLDIWSGSVRADGTLQGDADFGNRAALDGEFSGPLAAGVSLSAFARYHGRRASDINIRGVDSDRDPLADAPTMGQNPVGSDAYVAGGTLFYEPGGAHEWSLGLRLTEQRYDNREGEIGALHREAPADSPSRCATAAAPNGCRGYRDELRFARDQATLGYLGDYVIGEFSARLTWDRLETEGRTIPLGSGLSPDLEGPLQKTDPGDLCLRYRVGEPGW